MLNCGLLKHLGLRFWCALEIGCILFWVPRFIFWFTEISVIANSEPGDGERGKKKTFSSCT